MDTEPLTIKEILRNVYLKRQIFDKVHEIHVLHKYQHSNIYKADKIDYHTFKLFPEFIYDLFHHRFSFLVSYIATRSYSTCSYFQTFLRTKEDWVKFMDHWKDNKSPCQKSKDLPILLLHNIDLFRHPQQNQDNNNNNNNEYPINYKEFTRTLELAINVFAYSWVPAIRQLILEKKLDILKSILSNLQYELHYSLKRHGDLLLSMTYDTKDQELVEIILSKIPIMEMDDKLAGQIYSLRKNKGHSLDPQLLKPFILGCRNAHTLNTLMDILNNVMSKKGWKPDDNEKQVFYFNGGNTRDGLLETIKMIKSRLDQLPGFGYNKIGPQELESFPNLSDILYPISTFHFTNLEAFTTLTDPK